jgi:sirohydrochlorin cobaltochelatase
MRVRMNSEDSTALETLDARLRTLLPEEYQDSYEDLRPAPMRSAGLKYGADGRVAWNEIWGSFCDLAMAGGPPHKGKLLEPGVEADINAEFGRYDAVAEEVCRGIRMATGLRSYVSPTPGWVCVTCLSDGMADWLARAIVMENVAARRSGAVLELPVAPHFRLEKEIKNVVTVIAKTCHYWMGHIPAAQQRAIAELFGTIRQEAPCVAPDFTDTSTPDGRRRLATIIAEAVRRETGLAQSHHRYRGWFGVECPSVRAAIWMMRALAVTNVLARREDNVLFVPVNPSSDPHGDVVSRSVARVYRWASMRGVC